MPGKFIKLMLFLVLASTNLIVLAPAVTFGVSTGDGAMSVSSASTYHLDDSTSLKENTVLNGASIGQNRQASGSGNNAISQSVAGNGYSIRNDIVNTGSLETQASLAATSNEASYSQGYAGVGKSAISQTLAGNGYTAESSTSGLGILGDSASSSVSPASANLNHQAAGSGYADLVVSGTQGMDNSEQRAGVTDGSIASSQIVSAGNGVSSSQQTAISGNAGSISSGALSSGNMMLVTGNFVGSGSMKAEINTCAADLASASGKVSVNGGTLIDDSTIQIVGKESVGLSMEGITAAAPGEKTGSFSANVVNLNCADGKLAGTSGVAAAQAQTGYKLWMYGTLPMKWTQNNPEIKLYLNGNSVPTYLNQEDVKTAISSAANSWDQIVAQKLFAAGNVVTIDNNKPVFPADPQNTVGYNSQGWRSLSTNENQDGRTLAITYNWLGAPVNGYYSIQESDTAYNNAQTWSTTGSNYDVQSISLHELGHTIGLGHISDTNQIMNPVYTGKRYLGPGDMAGAQFLYGISGYISLQAAANGKYVCAENGGQSSLIANRDWALGWETFKLIDLGNNNVALQAAANGKYVCAENGGQSPLIANRDWVQGWETFGLKFIK